MIATTPYVLDFVESVQVVRSANYHVVEIYFDDECSVRQQLFLNKQLVEDWSWDAQVEQVPTPIELIRWHQERIFFGEED